jgi:methylglutaconyl-CoA hydratase
MRYKEVLSGNQGTTQMANYKTLKVKLSDEGVLEIILNRPHVCNAFNNELISELSFVFKNKIHSSEVRLVVLRGEGKVFCAGGDLNWMKHSSTLSYEENLEETRALIHLFRLMNESPKPLIGAIHGAAIGGGVGLVSVCDIVIATVETLFSLSEVKLGLIPACIGPFVIEKIGPSFARELFLSAERFKTTKANNIGLVHHIVEDHAELNNKVAETSVNILHCGPSALEAAKKLIHHLSWPENRAKCENCLEYSAEMLATLRVSEEGQEGVTAFLEKRSPNWLQLASVEKE